MMANKIISTTQLTGTYSGIALLSVWTAGVLVGGLALSSVQNSMTSVQSTPKYYSVMDDGSYDSHSDLLKVESLANVAFDELIGLFYQKMLVSQEELESDFKDVYFKNAWNLYEN